MQPLCVFPRQILQSTSVTVMMLGSFCAAWAGDQPGQERVPNAFFPMNFERHDLELASSLKLQARLLQELGYRGHARRPEVGRLRPPRRRQSPSRFACGRGVDEQAKYERQYREHVSEAAKQFHGKGQAAKQPQKPPPPRAMTWPRCRKEVAHVSNTPLCNSCTPPVMSDYGTYYFSRGKSGGKEKAFYE